MLTENWGVYDIILAIGPLLPLVAGAFFFMFGWVYGRQRWIYRLSIFGIALGALACQIGLAYGFAEGTRTPYAGLFKWSPLPDFGVTLAFRADMLSFFFALPLAALTLVLVFYLLFRQPGPERGDDIERGRIYGLLFMVEGAGLAALYSADLVMFYLWLEVVGFFFYLLAGPGLRGVVSSRASYRSYCASVFGGFALFAPLLVIISRNGGISLYQQLSPATIDVLLFAFVVIGTLVKAGQFPFQVIFGGIKRLPAVAHALISAGTALPLALYLPARLQALEGDRIDLFGSVGWIYLPAGTLAILCCGWLALRETSLVQRTAFLVTGSFGFVAIALGLGDLPAALLQMLGLGLAAPLLFLCADLLQIENAAAPPDPQNAAHSIPIKRPILFRPALLVCYAIGAAGVVGLPLSPAYAARWQTLSEMLTNGHRFYFGVAIVGLALLALSLVQALALFLQGPIHTVNSFKGASWWPLSVPVLLALVSAALGLAPNLDADWLASFTTRVEANSTPRLPNALFGPSSLLGIMLLLGLIAAMVIIWRVRKVQPMAVFNGGLLYGAEAEAEHKQRLSQTRAIVVQEEEEAFGFEDEFFKVGLRDMAPPPPKVELHLSPAEYFAPLFGRLTETYKLLDSSYGGGLFARILVKILGFIRRLFEWLTERFYPALAAFLLLIFIFLLTR